MRSIAIKIVLMLGFTVILAACSAAVAEESASQDVITEEATSAVSNIDPTTVGDPTSPENTPPRGAENEFSTDFTIHSVPYDEILSGGPRKDGIPPVDAPQFISVSSAEDWLQDVEPIIRVQINGVAKAYPIQILMWHEIVNDEVGGEPITVTFCPLCNTGLAFRRLFEGEVLDFGTTGRLRFSNLIMWDRQTETWWQQATGEAIAGVHTGKNLDFVAAPIISWAQFKEAHPDGLVLSLNTGFSRSYGDNPYVGYDDVNRPPFLYRGPILPDELPPVARILAVELGGESVAYPYQTLETIQVVNDTVGDEDIAVLWQSGTSSALDSYDIALGRDVGSANIYSRILDGETLTFALDDGKIVDDQTGSQWNVLGQAIAGELIGSQLDEIIAFNHFWFSWAVFMPETRIYSPDNT
jgi:hypothetical protein